MGPSEARALVAGTGEPFGRELAPCHRRAWSIPAKALSTSTGSVRDRDGLAGLDAPQGAVEPVVGQQLVVRPRLDDPAVPPARGCGRRGGPSRGGGRSRSSVRSWATWASERWIAASVSLSTAEVASSSTSTGGSARIARAIDSRWRCPPESFWPRSPTMVS